MKAALFYGVEDIRFSKDIKKPDILDDEVLVKTMAAGICGSDLHYFRGERAKNNIKCSIMGHEFSGEVVKVGRLVEKIHTGDRVVIEPLLHCGKCEFCESGQYHKCVNFKIIGYQWNGGFAEYAKAPMQNVYKIPDHLSFEEAALTDCYAVAVHALQLVPLKASDTVVVFGAATIGIAMSQVAKMVGVKKVIIISKHQVISEKMKECGIDVVITYDSKNLVDKIIEANEGCRVDVVYDCVGGNSKVLSHAVEVLRPLGKVGILANYIQLPTFNIRMALTKELSLIFSMCYSHWGTAKEFPAALDMLSDGRVNAKPLITHRFPLEDVKEAFSVANNKKDYASIKVMLIP